MVSSADSCDRGSEGLMLSSFVDLGFVLRLQHLNKKDSFNEHHKHHRTTLWTSFKSPDPKAKDNIFSFVYCKEVFVVMEYLSVFLRFVRTCIHTQEGTFKFVK